MVGRVGGGRGADIIMIRSLLGEIAFTHQCVAAAALILLLPSTFPLFSSGHSSII